MLIIELRLVCLNRGNYKDYDRLLLKSLILGIWGDYLKINLKFNFFKERKGVFLLEMGCGLSLGGYVKVRLKRYRNYF